MQINLISIKLFKRYTRVINVFLWFFSWEKKKIPYDVKLFYRSITIGRSAMLTMKRGCRTIIIILDVHQLMQIYISQCRLNCTLVFTPCYIFHLHYVLAKGLFDSFCRSIQYWSLLNKIVSGSGAVKYWK